MVKVELLKLHPDAQVPTYGTSMSACFDLSFFTVGFSVRGYDYDNDEVSRFCADGKLLVHPGDRLLVPTGLIMKIVDQDPLQTYSIRLHARSGMALKKGLILANSEGVIDVDYQREIYVMLTNITGKKQVIEKYERICQGEIVQQCVADFTIVDNIVQHSERDGGFGSTGTA